MHPVLKRQISKILGDIDISTFPEAWRLLLQTVSETYQHYEDDHALIERSLEISSRELTENNQKLRQEVANAQDNASDFQKMNALVVGRELRMVELKDEIKKLKE